MKKEARFSEEGVGSDTEREREKERDKHKHTNTQTHKHTNTDMYTNKQKLVVTFLRCKPYEESSQRLASMRLAAGLMGW